MEISNTGVLIVIKNICFILLFVFVRSAFSIPDGTLYHCPSLTDIHYNKGYFTSETNYNGLHITWHSFQSFPQKYLEVSEFRLVRRDYCVGGACEVGCVYKTNKDSELFFQIVDGHKSEDIGLGDWYYDDAFCRAGSPKQCSFYLTK